MDCARREAGRQLITWRFANGASSARPMTLRVNDRSMGKKVLMRSTRAWSTWTTVSITATLKVGANTLRWTAGAQGGANIDTMRVGPAPTRVRRSAGAAPATPSEAPRHPGWCGYAPPRVRLGNDRTMRPTTDDIRAEIG